MEVIGLTFKAEQECSKRSREGPLLRIVLHNESNLPLSVHPGDRDEAQDDAPSLSAHLCPQPWAQRCPWLKGP